MAAASPVLVPEISPLRPALAAGLAFLEGSAAGWGVRDLCAWFSEHLIEPGFMMTPLEVTEMPAGTLPLYGSPVDPGRLRRLLMAARIRVLTQLRGLSGTPPDDRFLTTAIFAGRVWRQRVHGQSRWVPRPEPAMPLSGIVLSLFAVDALSNRELYGKSLSVCDACDRVTFNDGWHRSCPEHMPHESGIMRRVRVEA
jgi:hypothetical protein